MDMKMTIVPKVIRTRVLRKFREGVKEFALICPGDAILVGLSGGKDSLALIDLLGDMLRHSNNTFTVEALHVRMLSVDYVSDVEYLRAHCERNNIRFHLRYVSFDSDTDTKRTPCFLCSWNRRKVLFETAQMLGCNKIALGHHQDDILHTALMNLSYEGQFSTMPCYLEMSKMPLAIIRPMCKLREIDLIDFAAINDYQPLIKKCPFENLSKRTTITEMFKQMEMSNPEFRPNLWHALKCDGKLVQFRNAMCSDI